MPPSPPPPPKGKRSRAELREERGHTQETLTNLVVDLKDKKALAVLAAPTIAAHAQSRKFFQEYLGELDHTRFPNVDFANILETGAPSPPIELIKGFIDFEAQSAQGLIEDRITVTTLINKVAHFLGMLPRATGVAVPEGVSFELLEACLFHSFSTPAHSWHQYARGECAVKYGLTTKQRARPVADGVDVRIVLTQLWSETDPILSTRLRLQIAVFMLLSAYTVTRPGAVVESSKYKGSGEAMKWGDIVFYTLPAGERPEPEEDQVIIDESDISKLRITVKIIIRLLKGKRQDESAILEVLSVQEALAQTGMCLASGLLALAIDDKCFKTFSTVQELQRALDNPKNKDKSVRLAMHEDKKGIPVLRAIDQHTRVVSPNQPWRYNAMHYQLAMLGLRAEKLLPGALRRGGANLMDKELTAEQRKHHMGHNTGSRIFSAYVSKLSMTDVQGLVQGREQNLATVRAVGRMSLTRDTDAPLAVSPETRLKIRAETNVKAALDAERAARDLCIQAHGSVPAAKASSSPEWSAFHGAQLKARAIYRRREKQCFVVERREWFGNRDSGLFEDEGPITAVPEEEDQETDQTTEELVDSIQNIDFNQLTGEQFVDLTRPQELIIELATRDQEQDDSSTPAPLPVAAVPSRVTRRVAYEYNPTTDYPPDLCAKLFGDLTGSSLAGVKLLLSLPAKKTLRKLEFTGTHYPDEEPTETMGCPVKGCATDLKGLKTTSDRVIHVHSCVSKAKLAEANTRRETLAPLQETCQWGGCKQKSTTYDKWLDHWLKRVSRWDKSVKHKCLMEDCDSRDEEFTVAELRNHLWVDHAIPTEKRAFVEYCYICYAWFSERGEWESHCHDHFQDLFAPYTGGQNGIASFRGYAGHVDTGLCKKPGICPFCVWNTDLEWSERMYQYNRVSLVDSHITKSHFTSDQLDVSGTFICPAAECKATLHGGVAFGNHLIVVHKIALVGRRNGVDGALPLLPEGATRLSLDYSAKRPKSAPEVEDARALLADYFAGVQLDWDVVGEPLGEYDTDYDTDEDSERV
ncbi:hypothetical protein FB45DRAFT_1028410 [Roridomyces roridus]|uniref:Uncharacterized protein n=1 Tax=Roridomyces roridus TaxID=1738132 RepID=A0AAD7FMF1_9AGAR|nr:hypothetical protein FB45DRAFT_1028410 [Roridomyces roridus]